MIPADLSDHVLDAAIHSGIAAVAVGAVWWRLGMKMMVVGY